MHEGTMSIGGNGMSGLKDLISRMRGVVTNSAPLMHQLSVSMGAETLTRVKSCFNTSTSPYGDRWAAVARGGKPLLDTGRLRNAFMNDSARGVIKITNPTKYANLQNYGGIVEAKGDYLTFPIKQQGSALAFRGGSVVKRGRSTVSWVRVKRVVINARQFIPDSSRGMPPEWVARLTKVAKLAFKLHLQGLTAQAVFGE
jgi:phage gpG-like protein